LFGRRTAFACHSYIGRWPIRASKKIGRRFIIPPVDGLSGEFGLPLKALPGAADAPCRRRAQSPVAGRQARPAPALDVARAANHLSGRLRRNGNARRATG